MSTQDMRHLLESIQLNVRAEEDDHLEIDPPSFRPDLSREVDLMEEVARLAGYDHIPSTLPVARVSSTRPATDQRVRQTAKEILTSLGFCEVISYSFIRTQNIERLQLEPSDRRRRPLHLRNPLSEDQAVMRTSLVPGILETAARNQRQRNFDLRLFELSKVFFPKGEQDLPEEHLNICALLSGLRRPEGWNEVAQKFDFFDIKGAVETLLLGLGILDLRWSTSDTAPYLRPDISTRIVVDDTHLGDLGQVDPEVVQAFDLSGEVHLFDLDFDLLLEKTAPVKSFKTLPRFPAVNRDLAIVVPHVVMAQELLDFMKKKRPEYVESINIFDQYSGDQVGQGKRSLAFRITYRSAQRSLTDLEVNQIHTAFGEQVVQAFQADFR
jgi:phenylalanyl-tRNA synthetase beta chain